MTLNVIVGVNIENIDSYPQWHHQQISGAIDSIGENMVVTPDGVTTRKSEYLL